MAHGIPASADEDLRAGRDMLANLSRTVLDAARLRFNGIRILSLTATPAMLAERLHARAREDDGDDAQITRRLERAGGGLPPGIDAVETDNSGPLETTVRAALRALYPVRA